MAGFAEDDIELPALPQGTSPVPSPAAGGFGVDDIELAPAKPAAAAPVSRPKADGALGWLPPEFQAAVEGLGRTLGLPVDMYNLSTLLPPSGQPNLLALLRGGNPYKPEPMRTGSSDWISSGLRDVGIDSGSADVSPERRAGLTIIKGAASGLPFGPLGMIAGAGGEVGGEAAGEAWKGTPYEGAARVGGALIGGLGISQAARGIGRVVNAMSGNYGPQMTRLQKAGIDPKLATDVTDSTPLQALQAAVSKSFFGGAPIEHAASKDINQVASARNRIAGQFGPELDNAPEQVGYNLRSGVLDAYQKFMDGYKGLRAKTTAAIGDTSTTPVIPQRTVNFMSKPIEQFLNNPTLADEVIPSQFRRLFKKLGGDPADPNWMSWDEADALKQWVGEKAFGQNIVRSELEPSQAQWRKLYGEMSQDMQDSLAAQGNQKAVDAYKAANQFYAQGKDTFGRIKELQDIQRTPEQVFGAAMRNASGRTGGGSNLKTIRQVLTDSGNEDKWHELVASQIYKLGKTRDGFSINTFLTNYTSPKSGLSEGAKDALFGPVRQQLDELADAARDMTKNASYANTSNTAHVRHTIETLGEVFAGGLAAAEGHGLEAAKVLIPATMVPAAASRILTYPPFIKLMGAKSAAALQGNATAASQISSPSKLSPAPADNYP